MTTKYSKERKEAIPNNMPPPTNMSVAELAKTEEKRKPISVVWKKLKLE